MAVIRDTNIDDSIPSYVATIGFFCVISCTVLMLRFLGFKATLNVLNTNKSSPEHDNVPTVSGKGAYRVNRTEFFDSGSLQEPQRKKLPAVKLPPSSKPNSTQQQSKSTNDLRQVQDLPPTLRKSTPEITKAPRPPNKNRESAEQIINTQQESKLHKKRLEELKKRDKLAAQEQAKQEKLRKEKEKREAQERVKEAKRIEKENKGKAKNKGNTKIVTPMPRANPLARGPHGQGPSQAPAPQYSTNTLESSISKSSGPPPYTAQDKSKAHPVVVRNQSDNTGNTSFSKPIDDSGSWDLIAQHRQQINRQTFASGSRPNQRVMDLQFNMGSTAGTSDDKGSEV